jgi:hypothetical protein
VIVYTSLYVYTVEWQATVALDDTQRYIFLLRNKATSTLAHLLFIFLAVHLLGPSARSPIYILAIVDHAAGRAPQQNLSDPHKQVTRHAAGLRDASHPQIGDLAFHRSC